MVKMIVHALAYLTKAVVEVLFASENELAVLEKMTGLQKTYPGDYLAVYDLPLDMDLGNLPHYSSVVFYPEDFGGVK